MDNWKFRFEELLSEIEGLKSPATIRNEEYQKILKAQLWDELCNLVRTRKANLISEEQYLIQLDKLHEAIKKAKRMEISFEE